MFEWCLRIIIVFCVLIPEVEIPPQDPRAQGPDFGSSEPLGPSTSARSPGAAPVPGIICFFGKKTAGHLALWK